MSDHIRLNSDFLNLLLHTDTRQQRALLKTITDWQTDALSEIFYNLAHVTPLNNEEKKRLKKHLRVIKSIANIDRHRQQRKLGIKRKREQVIKILMIVRQSIADLISKTRPIA